MGRAGDLRWMRLARALGTRTQGQTWPNPAVGCVIVADGRVVGRGWTQPGGRPHAEPVALAQAGPAARGATVYVTLEPCNHHGRTPPCVDALLAAGVARVVIACRDPDPRTDGSGIARLEAAGVRVETGLLAAEAAQDHRGFFLRLRSGRPLVTLKLASTLDGRIATASGESKWITGPEARRQVHAMRARFDAVMVGAGTARADDPSLTVRDLGPMPQPIRVVLSRRLDLPTNSTLMRTARDTPVWLCHGPDAPPAARALWQDAGVNLIEVAPGQGGQLAPEAVLASLASAGLTRVFCEGGGALAAALLEADLVDDLVVFGAGLVLGAEGTPSVGAMGLHALADAPRFSLFQTRSIGADTMTTWHRVVD